MYSVYQHWNSLKLCIVGKSYPPEFYSWIDNSQTRAIFEKLAEETEEDYQKLKESIQKANPEIIGRPITLADVLLAINKENKWYNLQIRPYYTSGMQFERDGKLLCVFDLTKDFDSQEKQLSLKPNADFEFMPDEDELEDCPF